MANEPERPIEKLLRATAKKRRDDAGTPLELHPATRRLLQGEVARAFAGAKPGQRSFFRGLGQLWPGFAWGIGMLAVLAVTVWFLVPMPGRHETQARFDREQPIPSPDSLKEALPPQSITTAEAPAAPAPAVNAKPSTVALAEPMTAARRAIAPEAAVQPQPLPKDSFASENGGEARERLALAAAPQLANREKAAEAQVAAASSMPAPTSAATANGGFARPFGAAGRQDSNTNAPAAPTSTSLVAAAPAAVRFGAETEAAKLALDRADQPDFAFKSPPAVPADNTPKPASGLMDGRLESSLTVRQEARSLNATQWFAQVPPSIKTKRSFDDKAAPAHPVLAAFQVEQAGRELRIVDGDGSVYSGYLQIADAARRQPAVKAEAPATTRASRALGTVPEGKSAARLDADQPVPQTYFFRVTGTNRSLQKKVVFTGNFLTATNLASYQLTTNDLRVGAGLVGFGGGAAQPSLLPLLNSRISGKVAVGNGQAIEINAFPTSP